MALPTWNQGRGSPAASAVVRGALGGAASVAVAPSDCITIAGCFDTEAGEFASCVGELLPMRKMTTRRTTIITQKTMTPMTIPAMAPGDTARTEGGMDKERERDHTPHLKADAITRRNIAACKKRTKRTDF
jgi:hypothetical protein